MRSLDEIVAVCRRLDAEYGRLIDAKTDEEVFLASATKRLEDCTSSLEIIQLAAQHVQQSAHAKIAGVVSMCLKAVFEEPYEFHIHFERKRGRTEARIAFSRDGNELAPGAVGGGVIDVAAFALRLAAMLLLKPPVQRVLVADEPMKNVNGEGNRERVRELLMFLPAKLGVQIIMSTGYPWLECGEIVRMK